MIPSMMGKLQGTNGVVPPAIRMAWITRYASTAPESTETMICCGVVMPRRSGRGGSLPVEPDPLVIVGNRPSAAAVGDHLDICACDLGLVDLLHQVGDWAMARQLGLWIDVVPGNQHERPLVRPGVRQNNALF